MDKKIKIYDDYIYTQGVPRIETCVHFLGFEDYLGIYKKQEWLFPVLITKKDDKTFVRPIIIDCEQSIFSVYATNAPVNYFLSSKDIEHLNNMINQSISTNTPLSQLGDKFGYEESDVFKYLDYIECIDSYAFVDYLKFKNENQKENLNICDFINKCSSNNNRFKNLEKQLNDFIAKRKAQISQIQEVNVFKHTKHVKFKNIKHIYGMNGYFDGNDDQINNWVENMNKELANHLMKTLSKRIIDTILIDRLRTGNRTQISNADVNFYLSLNQIQLPEEVLIPFTNEVIAKCNNKDVINNIFIANNLKKQCEKKINKHLSQSYTLGVAESLNQMSQAVNSDNYVDIMLTDENIQSFSNSEDNIAREDIQIIKEFLNDGLSVIVASNIIFKILEDIQKLDKEGLLIPFNIDSIKSYANINDKEAARLVSSVNEVIDRCIAYPDFSSDNSIIGKNR